MPTRGDAQSDHAGDDEKPHGPSPPPDCRAHQRTIESAARKPPRLGGSNATGGPVDCAVTNIAAYAFHDVSSSESTESERTPRLKIRHPGPNEEGRHLVLPVARHPPHGVGEQQVRARRRERAAKRRLDAAGDDPLAVTRFRCVPPFALDDPPNVRSVRAAAR